MGISLSWKGRLRYTYMVYMGLMMAQENIDEWCISLKVGLANKQGYILQLCYVNLLWGKKVQIYDIIAVVSLYQ